MCDGTEGPRRHEGGQRGLERGGAEERGPTETEERRQTGQPLNVSNSFQRGREEICRLCKGWLCVLNH